MAALNLLGLATAVPLNPPPSPPSLPPALPPPPPPLTPGYVSVVSENELRSLIEGAAADISISLPPSAHFELSSQISCASSIKVTIASSGEGATLDGQGGTGLFHLEGGCSLTLRRLNLVNGRADDGGVVEAREAGDVEIIDSTVRSCSATGSWYPIGGWLHGVRRVELATALQRRTATGREMKTATAASPRSRLATAVGRCRLRVLQRCGLAHRLDCDGLLS